MSDRILNTPLQLFFELLRVTKVQFLLITLFRIDLFGTANRWGMQKGLSSLTSFLPDSLSYDDEILQL